MKSSTVKMLSAGMLVVTLLISPVMAESAPVPKSLTFVPPVIDAPVVRVDAATRGPGDGSAMSVFVLTPSHVGLTTLEKPTLFWYLSKPSSHRFKIILKTETDGVPIAEPLLDLAFNEASKNGIFHLDLSEYDITLKPDQEYSWAVEIVMNPDQPSGNIVASGYVMRVTPSRELAGELANATKLQQVFAYAKHGIWYDALATISELIEANPQDASLNSFRATLLEQVGLVQVAAFDQNQ